MSLAYYNEIDPYAAQWLRNLIQAGHIAPGIVDERSIEDVFPSDLRGFTQCHFFAGIGIWSYALRAAGWGDDRPVWTGSCPCQPFSAAGDGAGFDDKRHLWPFWYHLIKECQPAIILGEQVASNDADAWVDLVQTDMEALDHAFGAVPFPAAGVGAPNIRERLYWVANSQRIGVRGARRCSHDRATGGMQGPHIERQRFWPDAGASGGAVVSCADGKRRPIEPGIEPMVAGSGARVEQLRAYGNAINGQAAKAFIEAVMETEA